MNKNGPIHPIETYRDALDSVFARHGVVLAYLYGSQARGDAGPLSDVDMAVLFARELTDEERFRHLLDLHGELAEVFGRDDVNVLDLDKGTPLLNNNVRLQGKLLYCTDENARFDFLLWTLQQYEDTKPLRREQNLYLGKRIRNRMYGQSSSLIVRAS